MVVVCGIAQVAGKSFDGLLARVADGCCCVGGENMAQALLAEAEGQVEVEQVGLVAFVKAAYCQKMGAGNSHQGLFSG